MDVAISDTGLATVAVLTGDLDVADLERVRSQLLQAVATAVSPPLLVVDMTGVTFIDSTGLSALISTRRAMTERGGQVRLAISTRRIYTLFHLTSLHKVFEIYQSRQHALDRANRVTGTNLAPA
jgi:anti-sigma B factor antagonist